MGLGILDMIGLAASLIFAIPVATYALDRLAAGEPVLGGVLLVVAALMVYLPRRLTTPQDLPGTVAQWLVGGAVADPEEGEAGGRPEE